MAHRRGGVRGQAGEQRLGTEEQRDDKDEGRERDVRVVQIIDTY